MNQKTQADSSAPIGCSPAVGPLVPHNPARSPVDILDELSKAIHHQYTKACDQQHSTVSIKRRWMLFGRIKALEEFTQLVIMLREVEKKITQPTVEDVR